MAATPFGRVPMGAILAPARGTARATHRRRTRPRLALQMLPVPALAVAGGLRQARRDSQQGCQVPGGNRGDAPEHGQQDRLPDGPVDLRVLPGGRQRGTPGLPGRPRLRLVQRPRPGERALRHHRVGAGSTLHPDDGAPARVPSPRSQTGGRHFPAAVHYGVIRPLPSGHTHGRPSPLSDNEGVGNYGNGDPAFSGHTAARVKVVTGTWGSMRSFVCH